MAPRIFRQASCFAVVGGVIAMVGAVITGIAAYHLVTGNPLVQANSKFHPGEHTAGSGELWFAVVGGLPFLILGSAIVLDAVNSAITIDEHGIEATNLLKRRTFQAAWNEISEIKRIDSSPSSGYEVIANSKSLKVQTSTKDMKELVSEIQKRYASSERNV